MGHSVWSTSRGENWVLGLLRYRYIINVILASLGYKTGLIVISADARTHADKNCTVEVDKSIDQSIDQSIEK